MPGAQIVILWRNHPDDDGVVGAYGEKTAHIYCGESDFPGQKLWQWNVYAVDGRLNGRGAALHLHAAKRCAESFMLD